MKRGITPKNKRAVELVSAGKSFTEAAAIVGTTRSAVAGACGRAGVEGLNKGRTRKEWKLLLNDARKRGVSATELAREVGVTRNGVYLAEQRTGIFLPRERSRTL